MVLTLSLYCLSLTPLTVPVAMILPMTSRASDGALSPMPTLPVHLHADHAGIRPDGCIAALVIPENHFVDWLAAGFVYAEDDERVCISTIIV